MRIDTFECRCHYLSVYRFDDREEPRPFAGRLPRAAGFPLPADFLPSPKGRLSLPLEPAGFLASSLGCLALPFAAPADFEDAFAFDESSVRGFFRGVLRDFLAAVLSSEEELSIDLSKADNSFGVKSRQSPTGIPLRLTFIIRVRSSFTTS